MIVIGGCASSDATVSSAPTAGHPTGGVTLELYARDADQRQSYYELRRDGTLGWGGGRDALNQTPSWTGAMLAHEIDELLVLLEQAQWFQAKPKSTRVPEGQLYELRLTHRDNLRTRQVTGRWEAIEPIERLLYNASLRRLDPQIEALPRAGLVERDAEPATKAPEPERSSAPRP